MALTPARLRERDGKRCHGRKWRGALPSLERYRADGAPGVVTASTGNHGAATAWAAERTGLRAIVFVPEQASQAKLDERAIARAVGAFAVAGIRVEASAAAGLAALDELPEPSGAVALIVTGRNIDDDLHRRAVDEPDSFPG